MRFNPILIGLLALLAGGATNREIAASLSVTVATVKSHLVHLYAKLEVQSRHGALNRAAELGLGDVMQNVRDKGAALLSLAAKHRIELEHIGFMGDDLIDVPAMQRAGFAATVPDAPAYIAQAAHWVATRSGGMGAARECCDLILASQQKLGGFFQPDRLGTGAIQ